MKTEELIEIAKKEASSGLYPNNAIDTLIEIVQYQQWELKELRELINHIGGGNG